MGRASKRKQVKELKLDLGCGDNVTAGFEGVDIAKLPNVKHVCDLFKFPWPFASDSVDEVVCSHFFEHVPGKLRGKWMNELYRIMKVDAKAKLIMPYYASVRAVQDYTHEWPPVAEMSFLYFNKGWRKESKLEHYDATCDFDFTYGYNLDAECNSRIDDAKVFWLKHYNNCVQDLIVSLTKRSKDAK